MKPKKRGRPAKKPRDPTSGKYKKVEKKPRKRVKVNVKKRETLKKDYLIGGKVVKSNKMKDAKGDGILHLKRRETHRTTKLVWED